MALLLEKDDLLREREMLMQEMQHRVANSLQIIASVLLLKARTVKSEETQGTSAGRARPGHVGGRSCSSTCQALVFGDVRDSFLSDQAVR